MPDSNNCHQAFQTFKNPPFSGQEKKAENVGFVQTFSKNLLCRTIDISLSSNYSCHMIELIKIDLFERWLVGLRDRQARARVETCIRRLRTPNKKNFVLFSTAASK